MCLEVHDRLRRLAVVRGGSGEVETLDGSRVVALNHDDVVWLGLVPFRVGLEYDADGTPVVSLERARRPLRGGDRRWLGRLWHSESPDLGGGAPAPARFEVHPMRRRYTPRNLSRQRTSFEGEDVVQRLVDGGWLCLDGGRVVWRPLERPGCGETGGENVAPPHPFEDVQQAEDYRRARRGDLSYLAGSLVRR